MWWGKGGIDPAQFATWGMNIGHVALDDLVYGEGDPVKVWLPLFDNTNISVGDGTNYRTELRSS